MYIHINIHIYIYRCGYIHTHTSTLARMLKAEIGKRQGIHTVTCLADLTCFYDTVTLDHRIEPATELMYPPLHLKLALDLYTGPRLIQAEA